MEREFDITFYTNYYSKNTTLRSYGSQFKVIKVYDRIWWRRILLYFGYIQPTNRIRIRKI